MSQQEINNEENAQIRAAKMRRNRREDCIDAEMTGILIYEPDISAADAEQEANDRYVNGRLMHVDEYRSPEDIREEISLRGSRYG